MALSFLDRERTIAGPGFNRWIIPPAALAVHLCIGQAYATSVYKTALVEHFDTSLTAISIIFSIAIVMLGLSAAVAGTWVEAAGVRRLPDPAAGGEALPGVSPSYAAVVLAGGRGRRLGGDVPKPALLVGGRPLLARVLAAVPDAVPRVVVGPAVDGVPGPGEPGVVMAREDPPGAGPVAGLRAGLAAVPDDVGEVVVLAADLPFLDLRAVAGVRAARGDADCAVLVDGEGREQWLCAAWSAPALRSAAAAAGGAVRDLYRGRDLRRWSAEAYPRGAEPWRDVDTLGDLREARALAGGDAGTASGTV